MRLDNSVMEYRADHHIKLKVKAADPSSPFTSYYENMVGTNTTLLRDPYQPTAVS